MTYDGEYHRQYYLKHKARLKGVRQEYYRTEHGKAVITAATARHRAAHADYNRNWGKANPDKTKLHRRNKALRLCGLTGKGNEPMEKWQKEFVKQGESCKICGAKDPGTKWGWHTDHNHNTGEFRGILCHACNLTLGCADDDPRRLRRCAEYLERGGSIPCPH